MDWVTDAFDYFLDAMRKAFVFDGRSRRKEYWFFYLGYMILSIAAGIMDSMFTFRLEGLGIGVFSIILCLAMIVPTIALSMRRLHDIGYSGWWVLLLLLTAPIVPVSVILVIGLGIYPPNPGTNEYGPNPIETGAS